MVQANYCLVKQNVGAFIEDSPGDYDRYPDFKEVTGEVVFTPILPAGQSFQLKGSDGEMYTVPITRIRGTIVEGKIWHEDEEGVPLFAGGEGANPSSVSYRVTYARLLAGNNPIQLNPVSFTATPGATIDLTTVTPISNAPVSGVIKGDKGDPGEVSLDQLNSALETKADKTYVDDSIWRQSTIPAGANYDDLRTPSVRIMLVPGVQAVNPPFNALGTLEVLPSGYGGVIQRATNWSTLDVWKRTTRDGVFRDWVKEPTLANINAVQDLIPSAESIQDAIDEALSNIDIPDIDVDDVRWMQSTIPAGSNYDDLRTPSVRIMLAPGTQAVNPPFNALGTLEVLPTGYNGVIQRATNWATLEVWKRRTQGGVFQEWKKEPTTSDVNAVQALIPSAQSIQDTVDEALSNIDIPDTATDWTRRVPLAVTTGAGPSEGPGSGRYRMKAQFTAPIIRWRLHISAKYTLGGTPGSESTLLSVSVGNHTGDAEMEQTVELMSGSANIPEGDEWVSGWQNHRLDTESIIEVSFTASGSTRNFLAPAWKLDDTSWVQTNRAPLWVWIEAETYKDTPTVALIGDSTGAGHGSIEPVWDAAVAIAGRKQEFLPILYSNSGDTLGGNVTIGDINFTRWEGFEGYDSVIIQAGSNDVHASNRTLEVMQDNFEKAVDVAKQLGAKVYAATIKPRYPNDTSPDVRVPYNEWLKTLPAGISGVIDYDAAVAPGGVILPEDNDDGAHLSSSGHHKMAAAYSFPIARPRVVGTWKP